MNGGRQRKLEVMWCNNGPRAGVDGWSFPRGVEKHLRKLTDGLSVLHLFGGKAGFGVRLDVDPLVVPDVVGDAWMPPFKRDAFDVVILDPPYENFRMDELHWLLRAGAWCARKWVIWFSTRWYDGGRSLRYERGWLVRVGELSLIRCLEVFVPSEIKRAEMYPIKSGPAFKYNRWLGGQYKLL